MGLRGEELRYWLQGVVVSVVAKEGLSWDSDPLLGRSTSSDTNGVEDSSLFKRECAVQNTWSNISADWMSLRGDFMFVLHP